MHSVWFGEFLGTLVLILLGNGVCAGVTLRKSYAADSGWMVITTGWALAVLCGVLVAQAFGSPGANLNPAITLAVAVISGNYSQLASMWSAQLLGAMGGAALMALHYGPHWKLTDNPAGKLGIFCTNGAVRNSPFNILSEAVGTAVLVVVAIAIASRGVSATGSGIGSVAGELRGVGHRPLAGRDYGLRHQPGARPGTAAGSLACADSRQGRIELELCVCSYRGTSAGRSAGGIAGTVRASIRRGGE